LPSLVPVMNEPRRNVMGSSFLAWARVMAV
jgi:hypothetical protein